MSEQVEGDLYHGHQHTAQVALVAAGDDGPTEWADVDFRSEFEDPAEALTEWLRDQWLGVSEIEESKGQFSVADPDYGPGELTRVYRVVPSK